MKFSNFNQKFIFIMYKRRKGNFFFLRSGESFELEFNSNESKLFRAIPKNVLNLVRCKLVTNKFDSIRFNTIYSEALIRNNPRSVQSELKIRTRFNPNTNESKLFQAIPKNVLNLVRYKLVENKSDSIWLIPIQSKTSIQDKFSVRNNPNSVQSKYKRIKAISSHSEKCIESRSIQIG